jgi:type I restriction enzyme M protein
VIFFRKGESDTANTKAVWVYDLRANMPAFGKTAPIAAEHFAEFEAAYGADPNGGAPRTDRGDEGRFRRFSRDDIAVRGDNLNIGWLCDASGDPEDALTEPEEIAGAIGRHFRLPSPKLICCSPNWVPLAQTSQTALPTRLIKWREGAPRPIR